MMSLTARIVIFLALWLGPAALLAQDWSGVLTFGGHGFSQGVRIEQVKGGIKYLAGHLQNSEFGKSTFTISCDTVYSFSRVPFGVNSFIVKFSETNDILWKRSVPGRIEDIVVDDDFNYYVVGYFESDAEFDGRIYHAAGFADAYVVKYSDDGVVEWVRIVTGSQFNRLNSICLNRQNQLIISGINNEASILMPNLFLPLGSFLIKLSPTDGEVLAVKTFSSHQFTILGLAADEFDNIIIAGAYRGEVVFKDSVYRSEGGYWQDGFLAKLDSNFEELWLRSFGSSHGGWAENVHAVQTDGSEYYFAGIFSNTMNANNSEYSSNGELDSFVGKTDINGNLVWLNTFGGSSRDRIVDLAINRSFVCVAGEFAGEVQLPSGKLVAAGVSDLFVGQYNKDGIFVKAYAAGSVEHFDNISKADFANSLIIDESDNIFVTGRVSGQGRFGNFPVRSVGASDCFLGLISQAREVKFIGGICPESQYIVTVYPNPTTGVITFKSDTPILEVCIIDASGRQIHIQNFHTDLARIDLSGLPGGIYSLRIKTTIGLDYVRISKL